MRIIGNAEKAREVQAVASGVLPSGQPVIVNADGTVSVVAGSDSSSGSPVVFNSAITTMQGRSSVYDSSNNKIVIAYKDYGNSQYGAAIVGTISGSTITFGSGTVFESASIEHQTITFDDNSNKVVIAYRDGGAGKAIVGTVSGTSISFGSSTTFESSGIEGVGMTFDTTNNKVVISYADLNSIANGTAVVGTVSGTSISFGTPAVFESAQTDYTSAAFDSSNNKVVISYSDKANSNYGTVVVATVSGTSISFGSPIVYTSEYTVYNSIVFDSSVNKVVISYRAANDGNIGKSIVGTVSGTSISFGPIVTFASGGAGMVSSTYDTSLNKVIIAYRDGGNSNYGAIALGSVSGTSISFESGGVFKSAATDDITITYDANANKSAVFYYDDSIHIMGQSSVFTAGSTNLTSENYIGMSGGVVDVESQTEDIGSAVVFNNTGNTTKPHLCFDTNSNKTVIGFIDNAVSEKGTAIVGTVSGTSISFGSETVYETSVTDFPAMVYDSSNNKVIVAYQDEGNTDYGTVAVGTVSGTSISFGTPVVFESAAVQHVALAFDSNSNKVVVSYSDHGNSEHGTAIVGTVSGTSISFGSAAVFESAQTARVSSTFDSSNNKVVIAYRTTTGKAVVATVSGTAISFGTPVEFYNALTDELDIIFDSNADKVVIGYQSSGSDAGLAKVGTVSGTSISFGAEATFESANVASISPVFDSNINKVILAYSDVGNSRYGTYAVGTISGTDITFGTPSVFASVDTRSQVGAVFDTTSNKVVLAYRDDSNSSYGTSVVMIPGYQEITRGQVADGGNAEINIKGAVDENQLSLTAGQSYYVQTDGTLGTTPADPSVFAGTAVAATKLIVKG